MLKDVSEDQSFDAELEMLLLESLRAENAQAANGPVRLVDRDLDGRMCAGFTGATSYGWLHVHMVWVAAEERHKGRARALLERAFEIARDRGCHAAWLDISSPLAHAIWEKLGFVDFGRLENTADQYPPHHRRWFMQQPIAMLE